MKYSYKIGTNLDQYTAIKKAALRLYVIINYIAVHHFKARRNGEKKKINKIWQKKRKKRTKKKREKKTKRAVKRVKEKALARENKRDKKDRKEGDKERQ